jgi:hypothetical protein
LALHAQAASGPTCPSDDPLPQVLQQVQGTRQSAATLPLPFKVPPEEIWIGAAFADYVTGPNPERTGSIHGGLDFRVPAGTKLYAVRGGIPEVWKTRSRYHRAIMIKEVDHRGVPNGRIWHYGHVDYDAIPADVLLAADNGTVIPDGAHIGSVVSWIENEDWCKDQIDIGDGKRYDHIHFELETAAPLRPGRWNLTGMFDLPLDSVAPTVDAVYFVASDSGRAFPGRVPAVSGPVQIIVQGYDRQRDGDGFQLGIYRAHTTIRNSRGHVVARIDMKPFDVIEDRAEARHWYRHTIAAGPSTLRAVGTRFEKRRFLNVTYTGQSQPGAWDTEALPSGRYTISIDLQDEHGNTTTVERTVRVR